MHLQKLVYLAHGWTLAVTGDPLVEDRFEAWDYGPVIRKLYDALRSFGSGPITRLIEAGDDTTHGRSKGPHLFPEALDEQERGGH